MGCSSSRNSSNRPTRDEADVPLAPPGALKANAPRITNSSDSSCTVKRLISKKSEESMEYRREQNLVHNLVHDEFRRKITEAYDVAGGKLLGKGGFGTVQTVVHKLTGKKFALKAVELSRVKDENSLNFFYREVEVMRKLDHPNICRLHAVYPTVDHLFMIMDYCEGGDLLTTYHFKSEQEAANIIRKVTSAVRYMHDRYIAHRDLKLDNILTYETKDGLDVKLVDFGLSAHFQDFRLEHDIVGTWVYMAPEVISGSHFPRTCDMWSIGVISYLLLCGYPPFGGSSTTELKEQIQHGTYQFHHDTWSSISATAKNFIKRLLVRNPQERMNASEAQHHPWLNSTLKREAEASALSKEAVSNLVLFRQTHYLKKLALELVARSLDGDQIRSLEKEFSKLDKSGSGTITLEEFECVLSKQGNLSPEEIRAMFKGANLDQSKEELNFNDFLAATIGRRELDDRRLRLAFERLDFDHSGTIDANDLKLIVGNDLGEDGIARVMAEFDLNDDGSIDFEEFKAAMRIAEPGRPVPVVRLATARAKSMPDLLVDENVEKLEAALRRHVPTPSDGASMQTSEVSTDTQDSTLSDRQAVWRASFVRCASKLFADQEHRRRRTLAVSDPSAKKAMAASALYAAVNGRQGRRTDAAEQEFFTSVEDSNYLDQVGPWGTILPTEASTRHTESYGREVALAVRGRYQ